MPRIIFKIYKHCSGRSSILFISLFTSIMTKFSSLMALGIACLALFSSNSLLVQADDTYHCECRDRGSSEGMLPRTTQCCGGITSSGLGSIVGGAAGLGKMKDGECYFPKTAEDAKEDMNRNAFLRCCGVANPENGDEENGSCGD